MRELSSTSWKRRGSSVIFDKDLLSPLITGGCLVSLREALGWIGHWPADPPGSGESVLVGGLETCLQVLGADEGEQFLRRRIKTFIQEFQYHWEGRGLVFGFATAPSQFRITQPGEEVMFTIPGGAEVRLSYGLWNGTATADMSQLIRVEHESRNRVLGGFHVPRIS